MLIATQPVPLRSTVPGGDHRNICWPRVLPGLVCWPCLFWICCFSRPAIADERPAYDRFSRDDKIRRLIDQLDDRSFSVREAASIELADQGAAALRALAMNVFDGSPEIAWRSKKAIELIGTHGDEDVFLKSMGILQLLFLHGSDSLDPKFLGTSTSVEAGTEENYCYRIAGARCRRF